MKTHTSYWIPSQLGADYADAYFDALRIWARDTLRDRVAQGCIPSQEEWSEEVLAHAHSLASIMTRRNTALSVADYSYQHKPKSVIAAPANPHPSWDFTPPKALHEKVEPTKSNIADIVALEMDERG